MSEPFFRSRNHQFKSAAPPAPAAVSDRRRDVMTVRAAGRQQRCRAPDARLSRKIGGLFRRPACRRCSARADDRLSRTIRRIGKFSVAEARRSRDRGRHDRGLTTRHAPPPLRAERAIGRGRARDPRTACRRTGQTVGPGGRATGRKTARAAISSSESGCYRFSGRKYLRITQPMVYRAGSTPIFCEMVPKRRTPNSIANPPCGKTS